ncbi:MAG: sigma-70 family RNA polymerase sigma factor [Betaproteobacteria bacterium]
MNDRTRQFEAAAMPHLDAAYNLARWLVRDEHAADDVVQEAFLRALRYFGSFHGDDPKPWLLGIVRNTCFTWLRDNRGAAQTAEYDDEIVGEQREPGIEPRADNPEQLLSAKQQSDHLNTAIAQLPPVFREVIILRELEELAYEDIARIAGIPLGTVMSRLSRARSYLRAAMLQDTKGTSDEPSR